MNPRIAGVSFTEILDSRGNPTLQAVLGLDDGTTAACGVPSGASTGADEAIELRDGDSERFNGKGVAGVARTATTTITSMITGMPLGSVNDLREIDQVLIDDDGADHYRRLGGNVATGVSMATARALALSRQQPLWRILNEALDDHTPDDVAVTPRLPVPHFNILNGGAHASNNLDFQEFMIAAVGAPSLPDAVRAGAEIYHHLRAALQRDNLSVGLGDEGGFAPELTSPEHALTLIVQAITDAGYRTGSDGVVIALDPAANSFRHHHGYLVAGQQMSSADLVGLYEHLIDQFPIWSIEDGLGEDDWAGWTVLYQRLGERIQIMGDDIFVTDPARVDKGVREQIANAALIKVNQIGTITQTLETVARCYQAGWSAMISHRSGETPDDFIADLAVGAGCGQLKSGAPARGERIAKYNRLLNIAVDGTVDAWGLRPQ